MLKSILFLPDGYFYGMLAWLAAVAAVAVLLVKLRRGVSAGSRTVSYTHLTLPTKA